MGTTVGDPGTTKNSCTAKQHPSTLKSAKGTPEVDHLTYMTLL